MWTCDVCAVSGSAYMLYTLCVSRLYVRCPQQGVDVDHEEALSRLEAKLVKDTWFEDYVRFPHPFALQSVHNGMHPFAPPTCHTPSTITVP